MDYEKLHIGCGPEVHAGWVNIDKSPSVLLSRAPGLRRVLRAVNVLTPEQARGFPPGVVQADVSRRIPAPTDSAAYVYSSHMIEHLSRWQALAFVRESRRVLRPGGLLRLATPDLELLIDDYVNNSSPFSEQYATRGDAFCAEYGAYADPQTNSTKRLIKKMLGGDTHQWMYDTTSLSHLLREGGFIDIRRAGFRDGEMPELETLERRERGLFVEAR